MKNYRNAFIVTLSLIFFTNFLVAQNQQKIDSLQQLLNGTSSDSVKVKLYGKLSWIYINTRVKTETARNYADSIKLIAEKSNNSYAFSRHH